MQTLIELLQSIGDIPNAEIDRFLALSKETNLTRGSFFIREGEQTNKLGFVTQGLFHRTYLTATGEESSFAFDAENKFIYECKAMRTTDKAEYSIQALEDSHIIEVDYKKWAAPFQDTAWWNQILLGLTASELSLRSKREMELMQLNAAQRYQNFLQKYAAIESRIQKQTIASYLGITPVSLSRIRKA